MAEEQVANGAQDGAPKTGGKEKKGFFYGWWIVIGGFMIMATCYTAFVNCMSLFQAQIVGDLGMTIGEYNTVHRSRRLFRLWARSSSASCSIKSMPALSQLALRLLRR